MSWRPNELPGATGELPERVGVIVVAQGRFGRHTGTRDSSIGGAAILGIGDGQLVTDRFAPTKERAVGWLLNRHHGPVVAGRNRNIGDGLTFFRIGDDELGVVVARLGVGENRV